MIRVCKDVMDSASPQRDGFCSLFCKKAAYVWMTVQSKREEILSVKTV